MKNSVGFFGTLFSICSGTELFPELAKRNFMTALGHFLLLCLLVSLLGAFGALWRLSDNLEPLCKEMTLSFGNKLLISEKGILPERLPEMARSLELPDNGRLFYAGSVRKKQSEPLELAGLNYFVYWQAGMPALAVRNNDDSWSVTRFGESRMIEIAHNSDEALKMILEETDNRLWREKLPPEVSVEALFDYIVFVFGLTFFLREFILFVVFGLALTGMISFLFSLSRFGNRKWLKFWKVCIYSGFPAVIIAGFFPMLDLPFFDFIDVYVVCLVIYWFAALRRVIREEEAE